MSQDRCNYCDHEIAPGVACDGPGENCLRHHLEPKGYKVGDQHPHYAALAAMALEEEYDAVRGID